MGRDGTDNVLAVPKLSESGLAGFEDYQDFCQSGKSCNPENPDSDKALVADPVRFAADVLGVTLWAKQREVLEAVRDRRRVAVKSGNGLGKDFTAAVAVLWYLHCHDPAIVLSTAPTFRQVRHVLWRQIHSLYRRAAGRLGGRMLDTRWELAEDRYALGLSANDADQFQGFHSENMFVVVDEAEGVDEEIYEAVEAVMTSANPRLLLIGNPTTTSGGFHRAFHRERGIYRTITISALDSPNVVKGSIDIPGLTTAAWVEERRAMWGEGSRLFRARVLGEFPDRGDDNLIAVPDIEMAVYGGPLVLRQAQDERGWATRDERGWATRDERGWATRDERGWATRDERGWATRDERGWATQDERGCAARDERGCAARGELVEPQTPILRQAQDERGTGGGPLVIGVDVARFGPDRSVALVRRGNVVEDIHTYYQIDTADLAGRVANAYHELQPDRINVDEVGMGASVVDHLRAQNIPVRGVNGASDPMRDRACANLRAEGFWTLSRRFKTHNIRIPHDAELMAELADLRYRFNSRGKVLMESKESMKGRGAPSPDKADALMLAFLDDDPFSGDQRWMRDLFI